MTRQIGLKDINIAVLTKDDSTGSTYEKPEKLERAISAKLTPKSNKESLNLPQMNLTLRLKNQRLKAQS